MGERGVRSRTRPEPLDGRGRRPAAGGMPAGDRVEQFDWKRRWTAEVAPHLDRPLVQASLDLGMMMFDRTWRHGDPPYLLGRGPHRRAAPGTLPWYRPYGLCHYIAFFSMAIGVLAHPRLDWRFASGDLHTVPVGGEPGGGPAVVMDILLFDRMTAGESLALAAKEVGRGANWDSFYDHFMGQFVPGLREIALGRADEVA
jgi:hypothetical protein